jgi:CRISPR-associated protein Csb1
MSIDLSPISSASRLLFNVTLTPLQGSRFQPTGFPDLGAAVYQARGVDCLLVESAQSMANRLELTIWDNSTDDLKPVVAGLSYVRVNRQDGKYLTSSIVEAHRLNSPYIIEGKDKTFLDLLKENLHVLADGPIDRKLLAQIVLRYDANSLLHGLFLAKKELAGGRLRIARALSAFIEAEQAQTVNSGGVKNDHVDPSGDTAKGFGNVPFHREEYTAGQITAYFNLDLTQIRGYGLDQDTETMLILLALYKIRALLDGDLRLRTACDLKVAADSINAEPPVDFTLPEMDALAEALSAAVSACADRMETTTVTYSK